ncbi:MAG: zinc-binding dehydrogenase [Gammaproteobacteria bacterium]|nr:zinc-binding dehydrogenase [Gammaproteobacteria bacterium]MYF58961.1 zinc-binding dehydrogenase [Gammaproteobacteria bacterium]
MTAVLLTRHGGVDALEYHDDVPTPTPGAGEVLIQVAAAGINNTDINTRVGWYSMNAAAAGGTRGATEVGEVRAEDASWSGAPMTFPRIQGADCCGRIVAVGSGVARSRIGERVIVRPLLRSYVEYRPFECWTLGSECDGAFAQFVKAPARESYAVDCDWSDAELASVPCAYSTAENMLHRASVGAERVLVTGASGGVGSAAVQLAKRRGAFVVAVAGRSKADAVRALGADEVVPADADLADAVGEKTLDVVVDVVAGPSWPALLKGLKVGGRYAAAGAIGGPSVQLDIRLLYLKDLTFFGCTFQEDAVFENLISYVERGEIRAVAARTFPLREIARAQAEFLAKDFVGKLVLVPPT